MSIGEGWSRELKKGSMQICIMSLLSKKRKYGFQIIKELRERSMGFFDLKEGTLYPALHRLEKKGFLKSEWVTEHSKIPRKYYQLTEEGRAILKEAKREWKEMVRSCNEVLEEMD